MTIGAYVAANPGATGLLEELGIDFCCGGHRDLGAALREKGLDPATFEVLARASDRARFRGRAEVGASNPALLPTPELIDHIVSRHHRFLWDQLPVLRDRAAKVASAHGGRDPGLIELQSVVTALADDLVAHLTDEATVLFPLMLSDRPVPADLWASLTGEHNQAGALLARIRDLAHGFAAPEWACGTYRALLDGLAALEADLHVHIHLENNVLFLTDRNCDPGGSRGFQPTGAESPPATVKMPPADPESVPTNSATPNSAHFGREQRRLSISIANRVG